MEPISGAINIRAKQLWFAWVMVQLAGSSTTDPDIEVNDMVDGDSFKKDTICWCAKPCSRRAAVVGTNGEDSGGESGSGEESGGDCSEVLV
jgi:hypothetical protein